MSKLKEKEEALKIRRRGFSYTEIASLLHVSISTVSLWLKDEAWSKEITTRNTSRAARENKKRISLLNKARSNQYKKLYREAERSAEIEFKHYKTNPLFIAGLMLYLSKGDLKNQQLVRITSSRSEIHVVFIKFLQEFLGVPREKMRFWILLYPDHDPLTCSRNWSDELDIPLLQFHQYQVVKGASTKATLQYGVGNTIIGSVVLKRKLMKWIELALNELK